MPDSWVATSLGGDVDALAGEVELLHGELTSRADSLRGVDVPLLASRFRIDLR